MSQTIQSNQVNTARRAIFNTILMLGNSFLVQGLSFVVIFVLSRTLDQASFGNIAAIQAKIVVWLIIVDLGLYNGLIGAMHGSKSLILDEQARAVALTFRLFIFRMVGASIGLFFIYKLAYVDATLNGTLDELLFLKTLAFSPYIFGYALQQSITPYLAYKHLQKISMFANIIGAVVTSLAAIYLAVYQQPIISILFAQSLSGFVAFIFIMVGLFFSKHSLSFSTKNIAIGNIKVWKSLLAHSWPFAVVFGAHTLWQRLDQIIIGNSLGYTQLAEYYVATKIVSVPVLMISTISLALFPDLQRVGSDAPEKLRVYIPAAIKFIFRYGLIISGISVLVLGNILALFFQKFLVAKELIPWFIPGLWFYWIYSFTYNALFVNKNYISNVICHLIALSIYAASLYILPNFFGVKGVVVSYNLFIFSLVITTTVALKKAGIISNYIELIKKFTENERAVIQKIALRKNN